MRSLGSYILIATKKTLKQISYMLMFVIWLAVVLFGSAFIHYFTGMVGVFFYLAFVTTFSCFLINILWMRKAPTENDAAQYLHYVDAYTKDGTPLIVRIVKVRSYKRKKRNNIKAAISTKLFRKQTVDPLLDHNHRYVLIVLKWTHRLSWKQRLIARHLCGMRFLFFRLKKSNIGEISNKRYLRTSPSEVQFVLHTIQKIQFNET